MIEIVLGSYLIIGFLLFTIAHFDEEVRQETIDFYERTGNVGLLLLVSLGLPFVMVAWGPILTYAIISGKFKNTED